MMKEHLTVLTSSQCFVPTGSWLNIFVLLKNVTCIRADKVWYCLLSAEDGTAQCFHRMCLDPVEPRKIYGLWFHWFLHSRLYLFVPLPKGFYWMCHKSVCQLPTLIMQMIQQSMAPTSSIQKNRKCK